MTLHKITLPSLDVCRLMRMHYVVDQRSSIMFGGVSLRMIANPNPRGVGGCTLRAAATDGRALVETTLPGPIKWETTPSSGPFKDKPLQMSSIDCPHTEMLAEYKLIIPAKAAATMIKATAKQNVKLCIECTDGFAVWLENIEDTPLTAKARCIAGTYPPYENAIAARPYEEKCGKIAACINPAYLIAIGRALGWKVKDTRSGPARPMALQPIGPGRGFFVTGALDHKNPGDNARPYRAIIMPVSTSK